MIKKILVLILLLCCIGCKSNDDVFSNKIESISNDFEETINGHKDKNSEDAMSIEDAKKLVDRFAGSLYDEIEYYDVVKFAVGDVSNDYYAFLANSGDNSYYILVDIYNGVITMVSVDDVNF